MRIMARVDAGLDHAARLRACFSLTQSAVLSGIYSQEEWAAYREAYEARWERLGGASSEDNPADAG